MPGRRRCPAFPHHWTLVLAERPREEPPQVFGLLRPAMPLRDCPWQGCRARSPAQQQKGRHQRCTRVPVPRSPRCLPRRKNIIWANQRSQGRDREPKAGSGEARRRQRAAAVRNLTRDSHGCERTCRQHPNSGGIRNKFNYFGVAPSGLIHLLFMFRSSVEKEIRSTASNFKESKSEMSELRSEFSSTRSEMLSSQGTSTS